MEDVRKRVRLAALTAEQASFALAHDAVAGHAAATGAGVFLYRERELVTERWLVDGDGLIVDAAWFPTGPGAGG